MKTYTLLLMLSIFAISALLIAAAPDWIQYNERVVGENSPYFDDVVNRPMKQIWGNFTSQHTEDGAHKLTWLPTPLPTATPITIPTPLPTCTPIPDFPTPLPTATPIPAGILSHPGDLAWHVDTSGHTTIDTISAVVATSGGNCHGKLQYATDGAQQIFLPTLANITAASCHTVRIVNATSGSALLVGAGANTSLVYTDSPDPLHTVYLTNATPGATVDMIFTSETNQWIIMGTQGAWQGYTSAPPPPQGN